ncbi:MAG: hypothetical protein HZB25_11100 [Candidatus Eisenbacteria bacterium]|nr:hypothetical protein [Candidatus Eisenbacteria bacterium]
MIRFQSVLLSFLLASAAVTAGVPAACAAPPQDQPTGTYTPGTQSMGLPSSGDTTQAQPGGDPARRLQERILYTGDPRKDEIRFDADSGMVELRSRVDNYELGPARRLPVREYSRYLTLRNYDLVFMRESYRALGVVPADATGLRPGRFKLELPVNLPGFAQSIFGNVRPNLALTGSETLTLGGTSNWDNRPLALGRQSKFPQLEMKQDLQVKVQGSIGGKVKVDVDQTSNAATTPLSNRIRITYTGDEDEVVRSMELGNTQLSLPGTQFVSYSGQHQGLFGLKTLSKFGPLDLTMIASKQEGQSKRDTFKRSAQQRTERIEDYQYSQRQFFYITDLPDTGIDVGSIALYVDPRIGGVFEGRAGKAYLDPSDPATGPVFEGSFVYKQLNDFYKVQTQWRGRGMPVIELNAPLDESSVLAVTYRTATGSVGTDAEGSPLVLKMLRPFKELVTTDSNGNYDPEGPWYRTVFYELRNIYRLSGIKIDQETFRLAIFSTASNPPQDYGPKGKYIEITGLDNEKLSGSDHVPSADGHGDGRIDADVIRGRSFVDYDRGLIFFPDPRPFFYQPDAGLPGGLAAQDPPGVTRPDAFTTETADTAIYTQRSYNSSLLANKYYLEATYREGQAADIIRLDRTDIIAGSEVIIINGKRLERGADYEITPEIGEIRILRQDLLLGQPEISVDYAYAPLFSQGQKALVGFSAAYGKDSPRSFATTWLFENSGTPELRPKLGEEPSRTLVGDINGQGRWKPRFLTRFADALPGVRATAESNVDAQGEVAMSLPNPNTKDLGYVDDMEGTKDVTSVDVGYGAWKPSSLPPAFAGNVEHHLESTFMQGRANYYNPYTRVREGDLKTNLTGTEYNQTRRVLELKVDRDTVSDRGSGQLWAGIQQGLSRTILDLSTATDVELWINEHPEQQRSGDWSPQVWPSAARLHIDFGQVSEDAAWSPNVPPNARRDTESEQGGAFWSATNNDNGLDTLPNARESGVQGVGGVNQYPLPDLNGDDFRDIPSNSTLKDEDLDAGYWEKYRGLNGPEGNRRFDTEDLDGNNQLDTQTGYFEFSVPLGGLDTLAYKIQDGALGWKFLRIPIRAFVNGRDFDVGGADWHSIKHVRIWVSGVESGSRLSIGGLDVVGNRWQLGPTLAAGKLVPRFRVNVVNNKDNPFYTVPPGVDPGVQQAASGSLTNREQSLSLDFSDLGPAARVSAFRLFQRSNSDYTLYRNLQFFLYGYKVSGSGLRFYIRLGNEDTTSYYEYSTPVPLDGWELKTVAFTALSSLKLQVPVNRDTVIAVADGQDSLKVRKRPSFNSIRRIEMGLVNAAGEAGPVDSGSVWVDELSLGEVRKDVGMAQRLSLNAQVSDLATLGVNFQRSSADFLNIGRSVGSGTTNTTLNLNMSMRLGKFMEPLGLELPVNITYSRNSSVPKFLTGSDVEFGAADAERQTTQQRNFTMSGSLKRIAVDSPWYLRYFVDAWSLNASISTQRSAAPLTADTTRNTNVSLSYVLPGPRERFSVRIPVLGLKLFPLPTGFSMTQNLVVDSTVHYDRALGDTSAGRQGRSSNRRTSGMVLSSGLRPIEQLSYSVSSVHDLVQWNRWFLFNVGRETQRTHSVTFRQDLKIKGIGPTLDWSSNSSDAKTPDMSPDLTVHNYSNQGNLTLNMQLPLPRILGTRGTGPDSSATILKLMKRLLAVLGDVNSSYTKTNSSLSSRACGTPPVAYLLGLTTDPQVQITGSGAQQVTRSTHGSAQGQLKLGQVQSDIRYDFSKSDLTSTGARGGSQSKTWPDVRVNWGALEKVLPLRALASNLAASTNYSEQVRLTSSDRPDPDVEIRTQSFQPLFSVSGDLKNRDRFTLSTDKSISTTLNRRGNSGARDETRTVHVTFKHTIKAPPPPAGQTGSELGFRLRSDIDVNFDGSYNVQKHEVTVEPGKVPPPVQTTKRLDLSATATYTFANNVRGTMLAGYGNNYNSQQDVRSHSIRLSATASLQF